MQSDKSIAVLSPNDAEILIRLETDLCNASSFFKRYGVPMPPDMCWGDMFLLIYDDGDIQQSPLKIFRSVTITPSNYAETLETILSNFNIKINA